MLWLPTSASPPKEGQLQQLLKRRGVQDAAGDFADYFDRLYTARCGKGCYFVMCLLARFDIDWSDFAAGREHPTDIMLTDMVNDIRAEPLYPTVQQQGNCARECVVLDESATIKCMFH